MGKRVFELAKEINMPSKKLLQKIRSFGISVESNFNVLTEEDIVLIKERLLEPKARVVERRKTTSTGEVRQRRIISVRRSKQNKLLEKTEEEKAASKEGSEIPNKVSDNKTYRKKLRKTKEIEAPDFKIETNQNEITVEKEEHPVLSKENEMSLSIQEEKTENVIPDVVKVEKKIEISQEDKKPTEKIEEPLKKETYDLKTDKGFEKKSGVDEKEFKKSEEKSKYASEKEKTVKEKHAYKNEKTVEKVIKSENDQQERSHKDKRKNLENDFDKIDKEERKIKKERFVDDKKTVHKYKKAVFGKEEGDDDYVPTRRKRDRKQKNKAKQIVEKKKHTFNPRKKMIKIGDSITVGELAGLIGIKVPDIIKKLMALGTMATINQSIQGETAALVASEFNIEIETDTYDIEDEVKEEEEVDEASCEPRSPIVTIMGHVDHGKTSLLDKIRITHVTEGEAGGITQHIGAYNVKTSVGKIAFLDTPGHEAFTAMRARGANVTDIVILVVAADDGVQPQTIEAIHHAQAANVPIIVAINKVDRPDANPTRIQQQLLEHNLVSEDFGGETIFVNVSAKSGEGIDNLLEMVQLQAELLELKAPTSGNARGVIIESQISKGKGPVGTVLVKKGTLKVGDYYVVGDTYGRVRAMLDEKSNPLKTAGPAVPVEILGFNKVPQIGEEFIVLEEEKTARQIAASRSEKAKEESAKNQRKLHLENLFDRINEEEQVELNLLIKTDVQGSIEALNSALGMLGNDQISVHFIHTGTGEITETDVMLASASDAIIIGFNVKPDNKAKEAIAHEGVDVRLYQVIYDAIEDVKKALEGLLRPTIKEEIIGHCEIRQIYNPSKGIQILGSYVTDGCLVRNALVRVYRGEEVVGNGSIQSLRRFKDDVKEVKHNYECGVGLDISSVEEGDTIEAYVQVEESGKL